MDKILWCDYAKCTREIQSPDSLSDRFCSMSRIACANLSDKSCASVTATSLSACSSICQVTADAASILFSALRVRSAFRCCWKILLHYKVACGRNRGEGLQCVSLIATNSACEPKQVLYLTQFVLWLRVHPRVSGAPIFEAFRYCPNFQK